MNIRLAMAGAGAAGLLVLAGCSSDPAETTASDNAAACEALRDMRAELDTLKTEATKAAADGKPVTVTAAKAALANIKTNYDEVKLTAKHLSESVYTELETAEADYETALNGISGEDTLAVAATKVTQANAALEASHKEIRSKLGC